MQRIAYGLLSFPSNGAHVLGRVEPPGLFFRPRTSKPRHWAGSSLSGVEGAIIVVGAAVAAPPAVAPLVGALCAGFSGLAVGGEVIESAPVGGDVEGVAALPAPVAAVGPVADPPAAEGGVSVSPAVALSLPPHA